MRNPIRSDITAMANQAHQDTAVCMDLMAAVFDHVKGIIDRKIARGDRAAKSVGATALVPTVVLRMTLDARLAARECGAGASPAGGPQYADRRHFYNAFAQALRWVLLDHVRARACREKAHRGAAEIRGLRPDGGGRFAPASVLDLLAGGTEDDVVALEAALLRLQRKGPDCYDVVMLKFYNGLSTEEVADTLGCCTRTVGRNWAVARAFLREAIMNDPRSTHARDGREEA